MSLKGMSLLQRIGVAGGTAVLGVGAALATTQGADASSHTLQFHMVRSAGAVTAKCIPHASAAVTVKSTGPVEVMDVNLSGLPKKTDFDFFVLQVPNKPLAFPGTRVISRPTATERATATSSADSTLRRSRSHPESPRRR